MSDPALSHGESTEAPGWCRCCLNRWPCSSEEDRQEIEALTADLAAALADLERVRVALNRCMTGGNNLASGLISALGPGFSEEIADTDQALEQLWGKRSDTPDLLYEAWVCWKAIMEARDLAGGPDWQEALDRALGPAGREAGER